MKKLIFFLPLVLTLHKRVGVRYLERNGRELIYSWKEQKNQRHRICGPFYWQYVDELDSKRVYGRSETGVVGKEGTCVTVVYNKDTCMQNLETGNLELV